MSLSAAWGLYGDVWLDLASPTPPRKFRPRRPSYVLATQMVRQRSDSRHSATEILGSRRSVSGGGRTETGGVPAIAFYTHGDHADTGDDLDTAELRGFDGSIMHR